MQGSDRADVGNLRPRIDPKGKSIPQIFLERVETEPDGIAFRYKDMGIYKAVRWKEYWDHVEDFCFGLLELGLETGDRVAIMGDCCPEWMFSSLAAECVNAIDFGIYSTCSPEEVEYLIENAEPTFVIVETQEYADKVLPSVDKFPFLRKVIVIDESGLFSYDHQKLITYAEVEEMGRKYKEMLGASMRGKVQETRAENVALLIYTSGTTGFPKGVMLTHENIMISFIEAMIDYFPEIATHRHRVVSHLSMAHILERSFVMYAPMIYDVEAYIGESVDLLHETLHEVQPTFFHGVPRIWEKTAAQVAVQIISSTWLKKAVYRQAMRVSRRCLESRWEKRPVPVFQRMAVWLARQVVFWPMLRNVGLRYVRYAISAGASLPPAVQELWQTWGVDLTNVYGSTECGGLVTAQDPGFPRPGSLGRVTSYWNTAVLADDGEIVVSGPGVFRGYWRDEHKTKQTLKEGWVHMGETGRFDEAGILYFGERKKDIMVTSGGKNISPTLIENAIKGSPYISEAVVFADGRKFPSALIEIDFGTLSEWARRNKVLYGGFTSLAGHPKVYELIEEEVRQANRSLARVEQVKKFRIIPKELDAEVGDTTPTRKIKRNHMYELFKDLVEEMYSTREGMIIKDQLGEKKVKEG